MRNQTILLAILASLTASGCSGVECAKGTVERDGVCEISNTAVDDAICGEFTHVEGERCVPDFPPTECDPDTTTPEVRDGVTVCVGAGGCESEIMCPTPTSATKQTICGRIYDFTLGAPTAASRFTDGTMPMPMSCDPMMPASSGPCALTMLAYDAIAFGMDPSMTQPKTVGSLTIDKCGRFRLQDIDVSGVVGFVGIGVDDATGLGTGGVTVTTAVAVPAQGGTAARNVEAYIVPKATTDMWAMGGPPLSGGIYATVFRAHKADDGTPQAGVTVTRKTNTIPADDYYFLPTQTTRMMIDSSAGATATGANGTALITNASVTESLAYAGNGGLGAGCKWDPHAGASLSAFGGIVFIQIFKKSDIFGMTCND